MTNFGAGLAAAHEADPLRIRFGIRSSDDFDHIAVFKRRGQRLVLAVNAAADGLIADIGVDLIGEVDRTRTLREAYDLTSRRKDIDAIREEVDFDVLKEFAAVGTSTLDFHQALQP